MDPKRAIRVTEHASRFVHVLRDFLVLQMADAGEEEAVDLHLAFSLAVEALRPVLVHQYPEEWKSIIFQAAEKLCPPEDERLKRPESKA